MIYLTDYTTEEWCEINNLTVSTYTCPICNKEFKTTRPFITKLSVGLETVTHECGEQYNQRTFKPRDLQMRGKLELVVNNLYKDMKENGGISFSSDEEEEND
jgi:hypothetical protein